MKTLLALSIVFFHTINLHAFEVEKRAVIRDKNFNAIIGEVKLKDLLNENAYEGKFFRIVKGKNNEAIRFDDSEDLQLKAATTYYHLTKARNYFSEVVKSQFVRDLPQLVIRIDLANVFNEIGHFANDNLDPQFNNALTVPAGVGYESRNVKPWGTEIWFRASKEIDIRNFKGVVDGANIKSSLVDFRNSTHMSNLQTFINSLLQGAIYGGTPVSNLLRLVESSVMLEAIYQSSDVAMNIFSRKIYRLDSALVPEIIYHEFSHVALSDHLELSLSTPVNEGLADYFAGKISNSKKLATNINDYNLFNGKKVQRKQQYQMAFERGEFANTDFVFGLLWNIGKTVGEEIEANFIYKMSNTLTTNVSIRDDLINATLETCKTICKSPLSDRIKMYQLYNSKNL